eukprot:8697118-Lingulodinium_polyedra.AAC.1
MDALVLLIISGLRRAARTRRHRPSGGLTTGAMRWLSFRGLMPCLPCSAPRPWRRNASAFRS